MGKLLLRWILLALTIGAVAALLPGVHFDGGFLALLWVAVLFALVNGLLGTILRIITLPLTIVTLGLFGLVVNAILVSVTAALSSALSIDGFLWAVAAALLITVLSTVTNLLLRAVGD